MKAPNNPLKELAVPFEAFDGAVVFYMLPYTNTAVDIAYSDLAQIAPSEKWVNRDTGEEVTRNPFPNPTSDPVIEAQAKASPWERVWLWSAAHSIFGGIVPITVDIEFKGKTLPPPVRGLKAFWEGRNGSVQHNWTLFQQAIGSAAGKAWLDAYAATQDTSMDGPEALQAEPEPDADPE